MQTTCPDWVNRLFMRLQVRYGSAWNLMWEGIDPDAVKADWEENLRNVFAKNPQAIVYALEHLPERVPTSDQFRKLCREAPWPQPEQPLMISAPSEPEDPKRVEAAVQSMLATKASLKTRSLAQDCIDNIERIVENRAGNISSAQKHMISHCLRMPGTKTSLPIAVAK